MLPNSQMLTAVNFDSPRGRCQPVPHTERMSDRARRVCVLVFAVALDVVLVASYLAADHVLVRTGLLLVAVWTAAIARGVWMRRTWAQVAALLTFGAMSVVALVLSVDVVRRMQEISSQAPPRVHLIAPALVTIFAGAVTALVASGVRRDRDAQADAAADIRAR